MIHLLTHPFVILILTGAVAAQPHRGQDAVNSTETEATLKITHEATVELPLGTHRPEILITDDGEIVLAVVQPMGRPGPGQVKHRAYRFDAEFNQIGTPFTLTQTEEPWGEPADHRTAMHGDELIVVYQTLNYADRRGRARRPGGRRGGPSEDQAIDQSLLLARFDLDGNEVHRQPIVAKATDFFRDNFPDHCLLLEGDQLLVSTGTRGGLLAPTPPTVTIREVDLEGNIEAEHRLKVESGNIQGSIGNSMVRLGDQLVMVSGIPIAGAGLHLSKIFEDEEAWTSRLLADYPSTTERQFSTSVLPIENTLLVGYISRGRGGGDPDKNPYHPRLLLIGPDMKEVADLKIGEAGFAHVHPTMARLNDRLLFCWSRRVANGDHWTPQVVIEVYRID
jgi:hypothetical protein